MDIQRQVAFQPVLVHQRIEGHLAAQQVVMAVDVGLTPPVLDLSLCRDVVQVPTAIAQMVYLDIGIQCGTGREEVGALSLGRDVGSNGIDGVAGHQVVDVQVVHLHVGIIAHGIGIEAALQRHSTLVLASRHVSEIVSTVGLHPTLGTEAARNAVVMLHIARQRSHHKVQMLGLGLELNIGTQAIHIVQVGHEAVGFGSKGSGQRHVQVAELHEVEVTLQLSPHTQRIARPLVLHGFGQCRHEGQQILTTQLGIHPQAQLTGVDAVGQRQRHV